MIFSLLNKKTLWYKMKNFTYNFQYDEIDTFKNL